MFQLSGPDNKPIYQGNRESNGKYTFATNQGGKYKYCFGNSFNTKDKKIVLFNMDITAPKTEIGRFSVNLHDYTYHLFFNFLKLFLKSFLFFKDKL